MDPQWPQNPLPLDTLTLCSLPLDPLIEIVSRCQWFDVLSLRRACRFLRDVSYSRAIWVSLFHRYSSQQPRKLYLHTMLHQISPQDLEAVILQHERAHIAWTHAEPILKHWIFHPTHDDAIIGLLPCGRYALAHNMRGETICYDLHQTPNPRRIHLFTYLREGDTSSVVQDTSYDVDTTSPYLRFNVALAYLRAPPRQPVDTLVIEVWHCEAAFDDQGVMCGFDASMLSRFDEGAFLRVKDVTLSGPYLAYFTPSGHITVVDWMEANGHGTSFRRRYVPCPRYGGTQFYFLPHGRILKGDNFAMNIYSFADAPITTSYAFDDRPLTAEERTRHLVWSSRPETPIRSQNVLMEPRRLGDTISNYKGDPDSLCFLGYTHTHDLFALVISKEEQWTQKEKPRLIQLCRHSDPTLSLHAQVYGSSKFIAYDRDFAEAIKNIRLNSFELPIVLNVDLDDENDGDEDEDEEPEGGMIQAYCDVNTVLTRRHCEFRGFDSSFARFPRFFFDEASHRIVAIEDFPLRVLVLDVDVDRSASI